MLATHRTRSTCLGHYTQTMLHTCDARLLHLSCTSTAVYASKFKLPKCDVLYSTAYYYSCTAVLIQGALLLYSTAVRLYRLPVLTAASRKTRRFESKDIAERF